MTERPTRPHHTFTTYYNNTGAQACLSHWVKSTPVEAFLLLRLVCVNWALETACWSCQGGRVAPQRAPVWLCSVRWHKRWLHQRQVLQHFCQRNRRPPAPFLQLRDRSASWSYKRHKAGTVLLTTAPCDPPGHRSKSIQCYHCSKPVGCEW